jgi:hypothetical protein
VNVWTTHNPRSTSNDHTTHRLDLHAPSSLGGDDVPAAGTTAAVLGCSPDEVQAAYGELFVVGRLRHEDDAAAGGTR